MLMVTNCTDNATWGNDTNTKKAVWVLDVCKGYTMG